MNMPGFTAAESLYRSRRRYHVAPAVSTADIVVLAAPMCGPNCDAILDRCVAGLTKGMICSLCANCGMPPRPPEPWPGSNNPFGGLGLFWELPQFTLGGRDCRQECHPIIVYDPDTKTSHTEEDCRLVCEGPIWA